MIGIELRQKALEKMALLLEHGVVALHVGANVIRLLPPLVITKDLLDRVIEILHKCLTG